MRHGEHIIYFFRAFGDIHAARSMESEKVGVFGLNTLPHRDLVPNLKYLIPMHLEDIEWPVPVTYS